MFKIIVQNLQVVLGSTNAVFSDLCFDNKRKKYVKVFYMVRFLAFNFYAVRQFYISSRRKICHLSLVDTYFSRKRLQIIF